MKKMKWLGGLAGVLAAAVLASFAVTGCDLELSDKDDRAACADSSADDPIVLEQNTPIAGISVDDGLTICFHSTGTLSDDQQNIIYGTSNSKVCRLVSGYFGDWATWDSGVNDYSATAGTYGSFQNFYKAFKGDDKCVFVFSVPSSTTSTVSCYLNGELACEWQGATSTFAAAMIDAISSSGVAVCTSTELTLSGDAYYLPRAVGSAEAIKICKWLK